MSSSASGGHERRRVHRADADKRAVRRGRDRRAELVESGDEPRHETSDVSLDRGHADLGDQPDPGDARVDIRHRRRPRVEAARAPVRPVALDLHVEDVLVREPPVCTGASSSTSPGRSAMNDSPAEASRYLTVPPTTTSPAFAASSGTAPIPW